jgi:SAM-dependent methyltransferase
METTQGHDAQDVSAYVLGHSEKELERLSTQAQVYDPFTAQVFRDAGLAPGMRVLDVGCGTGDVSFLAARMVGPSGQVIGLDRAPEAVATAQRRAQNLELPNTRFVVGDASTVSFEAPFDAAVARFVLLHASDPAALVRQVATQVRSGGVIVFQEPYWTGDHALPALPTWDRCARWIIAALQGSGSDPYFGLKLFATFISAGLPPPSLYMHAAIAVGPDSPLYAHVAAFVRTLLPAMERLGIVSAGEVEVDALAAQLREEMASSGGVFVWFSVIGAVARKPAQQ